MNSFHVYKALVPFVTVATLFGCASTHDLKRDGLNIFGGGFIDEQLGPGFFLIKAFSNQSPFPTPGAAADTFRHRAAQLCPTGYSEVRAISNSYASQTSGDTIVVPGKPLVLLEGPPRVVTSKIGHILCADSPITLEEAAAYLQ